MCLFTKDKFPREALSKIYVYKVLLSQFIGLDKNNIYMYRYLSPFTRDYQYNYGINEPVRAGEEKDYYSVEDINYASGDGGYLRFVDTGWLHVFTVEKEAYALCNKFKERYPGLDFVVFKMYIPEHANYYLSENGFEICSNRLVCLSKCM